MRSVLAGLFICFCIHAPARAQELASQTFEDRSRLVLNAALAEPAKINGGSPMHFWIAQQLFEQGRDDEAVRIVQSGMKLARDFIERREREKHNNIGYNGFIYWSALNCYVHWKDRFPKELLDDYEYVFTHAHNYKGTTGNLSMIHTLALLLADNIWGAENLPKDGNYGARGPKAIQWLSDRAERTAKRGSGEFASRPYMIYNIGTLLTLDNQYVDRKLRNKAAMAYEMSIAHLAGSWLRGHLAVPSGRSYPDQHTQQPNGSAAMLWTYFGGVTPRLDPGSTAIFSAAESFRPHPIIVRAATDRSQAYVCRSRWDGDKQFQTTYMNKSYAVFSTAVLPGTNVWGQTYGYGVMWDQPDISKGSHLWVTVPIDDETRLGYHTHGTNGRAIQFAQHRGSFVCVANQLTSPKNKYPWVLGYIPGGWHQMINDSAISGQIYLHYGSVMIALTSSQTFEWSPDAGVLCGSPRPADSEFRIKGDQLALALETALPSDVGGSNPEQQLALFRKAVQSQAKLELDAHENTATATFIDHSGTSIKKTFDGETVINGKVEDYSKWPLLDNPWMHQEVDGNLTITDGTVRRVYDVQNWTIIESEAK